ncbi:class D sortase [Peribacillus sp. SCS-155]|uniref:class D sortase n=1 Tax=Peribacillus sedimenti TaxID=3115297 RepID=UPI0039067B6F
MKRWKGICLILLGCGIALHYFLEWHTGSSSAESMNREEVNKYSKIERQTEAVQSKPVEKQGSNPQTPSTKEKHIKGKKIATLFIPELQQKYSVYWGAEETVLKKGVGMYVSDLTTSPAGGGHTVLSGHRDTVFFRLQELQKGDIMNVEYDGNIFSYRINEIYITDAEDRTVIVKKSSPLLTLTTCYPFNYVGRAPERYIIQATLIDQSV